MKIFFRTLIFCVSSLTLLASKPKLEDYFPKELSIKVKRKALAPEKRQKLKQQGISDKTLDLYGDVYVNGYESSSKRWGDVLLDDLGPLKVNYQSNLIKKFTKLPKAGEHPRIFCTDDDRPELFDRLENTEGGLQAKKILMSYTTLLKGEFDPDAYYAKPDTFKGSFGTRGFLPLFRAGTNQKDNKEVWEAYTTGRSPKNKREINLGLLAMESLRCWLYQDTEGGKLVAKAMETHVKHTSAKAKPGERSGVSNFNTSFIYDFAYDYMSKSLQNKIRACIIADNFDNNQYACFQDPIGTTSNWS